jgi:hypothetical protein
MRRGTDSSGPTGQESAVPVRYRDWFEFPGYPRRVVPRQIAPRQHGAAVALAARALLCLLQGSTTPLAGPQMLGQLITTSIPVEFVLGRVNL